MPIEINISTESDGVRVTASGSDEKRCRFLTSELLNVLSGSGFGFGPPTPIIPNCFGPPGHTSMQFGHKLTMTPESDKITIHEQSEILAVAGDTMRNTSDVASTHSTTLSEEITHTASVKWSVTEQVTTGFEVSGELNIKGSGHMNFTTTTGLEVSKEKTEKIASSRTVSLTLSPGQAVRADLVIKRRKIKVRVPLKAVVSACIEDRSSSIADWFRDDVKVLSGLQPSTFRTEAVFDILCFTDSDVSVKNC